MAHVHEHLVPCPHGDFRVRLYDPSPAKPKPALLYLHGGGWTFFSLDTHDRVMREYAARAGIVVAGIDYALSPEAKFPVALEQAATAVRWLHRDGAAFGVDGARLTLGGDSAGGNLSVAACLKLRDEGDAGLVRGMLLNYPAFEGDCSDESQDRYGGPGYMLTRDEMRMFWTRYLRSPDDAQNPLAAPLRAQLGGLPPAFFAVPECDVLTEQSLAMIPKLRDAGVAVTDRLYPGATHSFLEAVSISPTADRALADGAAWLRDRLFGG
ncbi:acetylesterase [Rhodospirillales bacterium TMPK1]|uniref:Acetylesterase n=2 Tax=Roseiterribacter gracilis TaxID=2812848 RepID=A0A8S8XAN5_9PROT|nr:acetylesterase [Rhodospirillales bacterium TMPK1]